MLGVAGTLLIGMVIIIMTYIGTNKNLMSGDAIKNVGVLIRTLEVLITSKQTLPQIAPIVM